MSKYLTLHVKDFAKIREAKIEAAPLTLFVGDNNSGKSHLLSLLWGLTGGVNFGHLVSAEQEGAIKLDEVKRLLDFWKTRDYENYTDKEFSHFKRTQTINTKEQSILVEGFNDILAVVKDELVGKIFNTGEIHVRSIRLDIPFQKDLEVGFRKQNGP